MTLRLFLALAVCGLIAVPAHGQADNRLRPRDQVTITVADQPDLSRKYVVEQDGSMIFPLVGRVQASGLTPEALSKELSRRLADGFLADPQVHIVLDRGGRVFVFGGVSSPGMYQLSERMTLIELLARAGSGPAAEALIIRTKGASAPVLPGADSSSDVIRVNLREFEKDLEAGQLSRNVLLEDGDTIFVPRRDPNRIFVSGQVHSQGAYSITEGTTLLQALALAGGPTERAALGRVKVFRLVDNKQKEISIKLEGIVKAGDTIFVPERLF